MRGGGVLVTLGGASTLPLDGGIARDVRRASVKDVFTPGSELRARFRRPDHPIAYGYMERTSVFRESRPLYAVRRADEGRIVLQWGEKIPSDDDEEKKQEEKDAAGKKEPLVVSGGVKGASELEGKPAILDIPTGQGRVVAFDFDPIHRYLTLSDFRLVWNVLLNWNDLPPVPAAGGSVPAPAIARMATIPIVWAVGVRQSAEPAYPPANAVSLPNRTSGKDIVGRAGEASVQAERTDRKRAPCIRRRRRLPLEESHSLVYFV